MVDRYAATFAELLRRAHSVRLLKKVRPSVLAAPLYKLLLPAQRRGIVQVEGVGRLYIDPASHLGSVILTEGSYEPEIVAILHQNVKSGDVFFDIGANEGVMSACAASLVGPRGCVISVEPQGRLIDLILINLALNCTGTSHVVHGAISDRDDDFVTVSLSPDGNTGASSIVQKYRWSGGNEQVPSYTVARLAQTYGIDRIDFVKVDVEGYEPEVIRSLRPLLQEHRIGRALVDFHAAILDKRGIRSESLHQEILSFGYKALHGTPENGYVLYGET